MNAPSSRLDVPDRAVSELLEQIGRLTHARGFSAGLNPAQWSALRYFHRANDTARTVTSFARYHASSHGTASQTISALVRKGYLKRRAVPDNRRTHRLDLTDTGRELMSEDPLAVLSEAVRGLTAEERLTLASSMDVILRHLLAHRSGVTDDE